LLKPVYQAFAIALAEAFSRRASHRTVVCCR
jgi:hypothetical protein